jgi:hypothetical protein
MNEWIKCEDQSPEEGQKVKIKSDDLWNGEAIFKNGKFAFCWVRGACFGEISHWKVLNEN